MGHRELLFLPFLFNKNTCFLFDYPEGIINEDIVFLIGVFGYFYDVFFVELYNSCPSQFMVNRMSRGSPHSQYINKDFLGNYRVSQKNRTNLNHARKKSDIDF